MTYYFGNVTTLSEFKKIAKGERAQSFATLYPIDKIPSAGHWTLEDFLPSWVIVQPSKESLVSAPSSLNTQGRRP